MLSATIIQGRIGPVEETKCGSKSKLDDDVMDVIVSRHVDIIYIVTNLIRNEAKCLYNCM